MSIRFVDIELSVLTSKGTASYRTAFGPGLNVLAAPNTWGKSTLLQSLMYVLGLEGMFSASRRSPLGEAMTRVVSTADGRASVLESRITLTIRNDAGKFMRVRRFPVSGDIGATLIQTWSASSEAELAESPRIDTIVRESGSATREMGFHRVLSDFLGWTLPLVPNYSGTETPLYLELLFPLFYVEQKFGWSGIAPRVPTYLRIKDPLRRSVEYVLGLSTLSRIKSENAIREEIAEIRQRWSVLVAKARESAATRQWRVSFLADQPTSSQNRRPAVVEVLAEDRYLPLSSVVERWRDELPNESLSETVASAQSRTARSEYELYEAERRLRRLGAMLRRSQEEVSLVQADVDAIAARVASVESDRKRFRDIKRLQVLGSDLRVTLLTDGQCPTCEQNLDSRSVATGAVTSVEESAALADAERQALLDLSASTEVRLADALRMAEAHEEEVRRARQEIRTLRDELAGPSNAPSYVEVRRRLELMERISAADSVINLVASVDEALDELSEQLDDARSRLEELKNLDSGSADSEIINSFRNRFSEQLDAYGLRSLPVDNVTIDETTLLPVDDGVELAFDVSLGLSASDSIRTKWAYYLALMEAAQDSINGHHTGTLILDEPRQQETDYASLGAFLNRLSRDSCGAQIIYATSERADVLEPMLSGIENVRLGVQGERLLLLSS